MNQVENRSENNHVTVLVEWSRFDKVTIKFTTILTIMGVDNVTHELADRRLIKSMKLLTGSIEERCKQFAEQKSEAVTTALKHSLAALTQARHVTPETN